MLSRMRVMIGIWGNTLLSAEDRDAVIDELGEFAVTLLVPFRHRLRTQSRGIFSGGRDKKN